MKRILFLLLTTIFFTVPNFTTTLKYTSIPVVNTVTETVYVTKTGSKYHRNSCHYLKKVKLKLPNHELNMRVIQRVKCVSHKRTTAIEICLNSISYA